MTSLLIDLDDARAVDPVLVGGKAAALAQVRRAGLPTLAGVVLSTEASIRYDSGTAVEELADLDDVLDRLSPAGEPLVVRSSSVVEDLADTSAAGQFESVLDVRGFDALRSAIQVVLDSRERAGAAREPMAVLIQPLVEPELAGVAFGIDPVSGRTDRRIVTAVRGRPAALVSGEVDGSRWALDPAGKVLTSDVREGADASRSALRDVVHLGEHLSRLFEGPQDLEWALVDGTLIVLQSRPVTTIVRGVPAGPVFGPGPVAETFPDPLAPLEEDLWVPPLREAVRAALRISGTVPERDLAHRELVVTVGGRVALDLEVTGGIIEGASRWRLGIGARVRRLRSAWRIGRLRAALPHIADELTDHVDIDLGEVPPLEGLSTRQLVALIDRGRGSLRSLHAHEILMGLVTNPSTSSFTGGAVALRVLAEARREGWSDPEILQRAPAVLALIPPRVSANLVLPSDASAGELTFDAPAPPDMQVRREALRLRVRWMQELVGQAAYEVGVRLTHRRLLAEPVHVRHLSFDELSALVTGRATLDPGSLAQRADAADEEREPPLPTRFRVSDRGMAIPVESRRRGGGVGAGGGVGQGPVTHDATQPPDGSVLVVGTLTPAIGPQLRHLQGIVSETGSVLSHLAILAREAGVAVVVAYDGARQQLPEGTTVRVDGQAGEVTTLEGR